MEFSGDSKSLAGALDHVQEAVEKKSTVAILSHVLVDASSNGRRLAAKGRVPQIVKARHPAAKPWYPSPVGGASDETPGSPSCE